MEFVELGYAAVGTTNSRIITVRRAQNDTASILALLIGDFLAGLLTVGAFKLADATFYMPWLLAGFLGFCLALVSFGLYPGRGLFGPERIRRRGLAVFIAFVPPIIASGLFRGDWPGVLLQFLLFGLGLFFLSAFFEVVAVAILLASKLWQQDAIIMGEPHATRKLALDLTLFPELGLRPVAQASTTLSADPAADDARQAPPRRTSEYLADASAPLPTICTIDQALPDLHPGQQKLSRFLKRGFDIVSALLLLVITSPILLLVPLLIVLHDGRPVFFKQRRGGKDGKDILVWKFRSMYKDASTRLESVLVSDPKLREEWNRYFKLHKDPRVLPIIGDYIRRSSVDELPQLWNVLKGDMSLIGPRPFPRDHLAAFSREFCDLRQRVEPELSGLWQVTLRSDGDLPLQERLDSAYIRGWSIWLDLYILFRTPVVLITGRGAV